MKSAFELLAEPVQRWVYRQGWQALRPIQEAAIEPILNITTDIILAASTASGKTEAAFLPILSHLINRQDEQETGCQVLYIAPLKALINDQFDRLELLTESMSIPVTPWHGDIAAGKKNKFKQEPDGILLITPESIESIMVNQGSQLLRYFQGLQYVVIDELHSYIGSERGIQLQSLLHRLELSLRRRLPRIGLSATLGDMDLAAEYLRPEQQRRVTIIEDPGDKEELRIQVRGYKSHAPDIDLLAAQSITTNVHEDDKSKIVKDLYKTLRGSHNLIFANSRNNVETYADRLRLASEENRVPNEFLPHHGSLSKDLREFAETEIKNTARPMNVICTSTLEMGIDIGSVDSIAQIGPPSSVATLRQRLGRSGRRTSPPTLRMYIQEEDLTPHSALQDCLRESTVQAIAMTQLLLNKWCEPPTLNGLHLSTCIQQILSIIAQHGGANAEQIWKSLCISGPFSHVSKNQFTDLLRCMGDKHLIEQSNDHTLYHGKIGEQIVNHYTFYAAFNTPEEYTLLDEGKRLGSLPIDKPLQTNSYLIFGGRRWLVVHVDIERRVIDLKAAKGGKAPAFGGLSGIVHDKIRETMFCVYQDVNEPIFLNPVGKDLLSEGRDHFSRYNLKDNWILQSGKDCYLFFWKGTIVLDTIAALLRMNNIQAECIGMTILAIGSNRVDVVKVLKDISNESTIQESEIAAHVKNKWRDKYDNFLSPKLLDSNFASHHFDVTESIQVIRKYLSLRY